MALLSIPLLLTLGFSVGQQSESSAYRCDREVDLRAPGSSAEGVPFLDQGDTNLCAPYTASAMIDSWRTKRIGRPLRAEERASPMALAIEYAAKNDFPYTFPIQNSTDPLSKEAFRWGGIVCVFVASAREIGVCTDEVLRETQGASLEAIAKTEALFQALRDYQKLKPAYRDERRKKVAERIRMILTAMPPALDARDLPSVDAIEQELVFFTGDDPYVPLSRLLLARCRRQRSAVADLPVCRTMLDAGLDAFGWSFRRVPFRESEVFRKARDLLGGDRPTPPAITYCHKVIRRGRGYRPNSILADGCSSHWSLIVGERTKAGRCQFLVRDTDGGKPEKVSSDWEIDRGDVWVDAETLMKSVYALEWLDPSSPPGN